MALRIRDTLRPLAVIDRRLQGDDRVRHVDRRWYLQLTNLEVKELRAKIWMRN